MPWRLRRPAFVGRLPSSKSSSREWVRAFEESLTSRGAAGWLDEWRVHAGEPIQEAMEQGLRSRDTIALIVNRDNVCLPNLFFEHGVAVPMGKRAVSIVAKELESSRLPYPPSRAKASPPRIAGRGSQEVARGNGVRGSRRRLSAKLLNG